MRLNEKGSALLELAVSFPFVLLLLLGVIDFGRVFQSAVTLQGAAQAGAQRGVFDIAYATDLSAQRSAALQDATDLRDISVSARQFCQCGYTGEQACNTACASGGTQKVFVSVTAQQRFRPLVAWPGIPNPAKLSTNVTMRAK